MNQQQSLLDTQIHGQEQIAANTSALQLPFDHPRPAAGTPTPSQESLDLDAPSLSAVNKFCEQQDVSRFDTLLAAFTVLLSRYTGQYDIVVSLMPSIQPDTPNETMDSLMQSLLSAALHLEQGMNVQDLMNHIKQVSQAVRLPKATQPANAHSSPDELRATSGPTSTQVMFGLTEDALSQSAATAVQQITGNFDLALIVSSSGDSLNIQCDYAAALFDRPTIERLLGHYRILLESLVNADKETPVSQLAMLTKEEEHQILVQWNETKRNYPEAQYCIHHRFEAQAERTPDAVAVIFPTPPGSEHQLTFAQLNQRANQLAHHLQALDVGPDTAVAISMDRSLDMMVAVLAVLKAGGAYVPIDPNYPRDRSSYILDDTQVPVILTQQHLIQQLPEYEGHTICLDSDWESVNQQSKANPSSPVTLENLTYIIYTSGSTGKPKGVALGHRSLANLIAWQLENSDLGTGSRTLQFASLSFDVSFQEIFATWCAGGTLVLVPEETRRDSAQLLQYIVDHAVERLFLPFVALQGLAEAADAYETLPDSLREIVTAGEQLQVNRFITKLFSLLTDCSLENQYGPSESHVVTAFRLPTSVPDWPLLPPIGRPIANTQIYLLDRDLHPVPIGVAGELYIGGTPLAEGYVNNPDLTVEKFIPNPFDPKPDGRLYKTGDLARFLPDGNVDFLGRMDDQVKIRGFRVELGEIETVLSAHPAVKQAVVTLREDAPGDKRLAAYLVMGTGQTPSPTELRRHLMDLIPEYMVPSLFIGIEAMPKTPSGKINRRALPTPGRQRPQLEQPFVAPKTEAERRLAEIWSSILRVDQVGVNDNFFDLGGDSLLAHRVAAETQQVFGLGEMAVIKLFQYSTVGGLAEYLDQGQADQRLRKRLSDRSKHRKSSTRAQKEQEDTDGFTSVAVIGMACRLPGANDIEQLWHNLSNGVESVSFFADAELDPSVPLELRQNPQYVKARGIIEDADKFDAAFFGINPREAEIMDPQQRVFLEIAWAALESAGYDPDRFDGSIGVYAGVGNNTYYLNNVLTHPTLIDRVGDFQVMVANEKDYVASRVAYKLNLTGPAISLYTACSTSLVAVSQAFHSLNSYQCDMALAGGVSITVPQNSGYLFQEGGMLSNDGHTRSFDIQARGTVFGNGAGAVVLKRLEDALADGDQIYAVIRGAAANNDGAAKVSYAAPSVEGQAEVIALAQAYANIDPRTISYVETHGTATPLGDPIEIEALTQAFRLKTDAKQFCAIGSIKSNFGHAIASAGVAGMIKTVLALHHKRIPPTLFFKKPNPNIDFANSPFFVKAELENWQNGPHPRRAGVSSFGVGGTNAHVVLEEAAPRETSGPSRPLQLFLLSAKTETALNHMTRRLSEYLERHPNIDPADAAYTLQLGRKEFNHRQFAVCQDRADAAKVLETTPPRRSGTRYTETRQPEIVFMFPGQGSQYVNMGLNLYQHEALFRETVDQCAEILRTHLGQDLRETLYPAPDDIETAQKSLKQTFLTQPALFTIEYALAKLWQKWGINPQAMIGHSIGEFVAACMAGIFSLEDVLMLVATRGRLMQDLPGGSMLSVRMLASELEPKLSPALSIAAINSPALCVVAGPTGAVADLQDQLTQDGVACQQLHTSHAFHSAMMDSIVEPFADRVSSLELSSPKIPILSTVTGDWMTDEQATDPMYWAKHLRATVRFATAVQNLWEDPTRVLLEVGPRTTTATLARQQAQDKKNQIAVPSLSDSAEGHKEWEALLKAVGQLWLAGITPDWDGFYADEKRLRVANLPSYPFERNRFWLEPAMAANVQHSRQESQVMTGDVMPDTQATASQQESRIDRLIPQLKEIIEDISGFDVSAVSPDTSFLEIGLDSLSLTQIALALQKEFGVNIAFRQLLEDYPTLETLAEFFDAQLPPETLPVAPNQTTHHTSDVTSSAVAPVIQPNPPEFPQLTGTPIDAAAAPGTVQAVIAQQLRIMSRQLEILGVSGHTYTPASSPSTTHQKIATARTEQAIQSEASLGATAEESPQSFGAAAQIATTLDDSLSPKQQSELDGFIRQYTTRTAQSKQYAQAHRVHLADPRTVSGFNPELKEIVYPVVAARSSGSKIWDLDGNEYVDLTNGFGSNFFGYSPAFINQAIVAQIERGVEIGPQTPLAGEVAELITEFTGHERVAFCNTGSEAVMGAMRLARTVTGRNTVAIFSGAYHGIFDEVIVRGTKKLRTIPAAPGIMREAVQNMLVLDYDSPESLDILQDRAQDLAAILVEPVQSRLPGLQPREFLHQLRHIADESGCALIMDEVITGFRIHPGGAQAIFEVRGDIATYGKVVSAGLPIGVIAGNPRFMDALDGGYWQYGDDSFPEVGVTYFAGTFVRHPLAMAAAKAALEYLKQGGPELQRNLNERTDQLVAELNQHFEQLGAPIKLTNFGSLMNVNYSPELARGELLFYWLRYHGVHIWDHRPCFLTIAHSDADIEFVIQAFKQSVTDMQAAGFLPAKSGHSTDGNPDQEPKTVHTSADEPPAPGARLGRDPDGNPAWFVPDPDRPGKYLRVGDAR